MERKFTALKAAIKGLIYLPDGSLTSALQLQAFFLRTSPGLASNVTWLQTQLVGTTTHSRHD